MKTKRQARREAQTLWRLCLVNGELDDDRARRVVDALAASGRSASNAVLRPFVRRVRVDEASRTAVVASATPLDAALRARIERDLARRRGGAVTTTFLVDPALIGGIRVRLGNDVYDGTVRAELTALESRFSS
jgi:F-type H+-transporting ATPase subunit delta